MERNVASQKWTVFAFNRTTNVPVTGDAANITAKIRVDNGTATASNDTNPTETEDGYYDFDLTQAESNGTKLQIFPESSTADVQVIGVPGVVYTKAANASLLGINSSGHVSRVTLVDTTTTNTDMRGTDSALTTLGSNAPAGWINEAAFANNAITDAKVASDVTIASVTNAVTVGTNNDKTGYSLATAPPTASDIATAVWAAGTRTLTGFGTLVSDIWASASRTLTAFAGFQINSDMTAVKAKTDNLPASPAATGDIPSASTIADAVWDEATSGHSTAGTFGKYVTDLFGLVAKFSGITSLASWLGAIAGKTADTATRAEINATTAGASYNETTDSLEAAADASVAQTGDAYSYLTTNLGLLGANATEAGGTGDQFTGIASVGAVAGTVGGVAGTTQTLDALATLIRGADGDTLKTLSDQIDAIPTTIRVKKNAALAGFPIIMLDTSGDPATGKTVAGTVSLDGGAFASLTNPVSEVSGGLYKVDLASADTNGNTIVMRFSATGCRTRFVEIVTQP